ncbi:MAG: hypothetical protein HQ579_08215, partial [Candidatus Omnitrophica bacterium]|nr:hypothetical protein [Candidatus Omnitrophota bacterium]
LEKLGGLIKFMPIAFFTFLIASFAISGVPPFNGFVSKWMVYQGVIDTAKSGGHLWILWLVAAMFGSALTLASFMKLIHAIFLGQPSRKRRLSKDESRLARTSMLIPVVILASLCVIFGVFAYRIPLSMLIVPSLNMNITFTGTWNAGLATVMLLVGILLGAILYFVGQIKKSRTTEIFVGGERVADIPEMRISGVEFYNSVEDIGVLKFIYGLAKKKVFDIYEVGSRLTFGFNKMLRYVHNGVLPTYLAWCILGMAVLFYILLK